MTSSFCEHRYYAVECPECPRICYRCRDTGYIQCGDNNTGQRYDCTRCPWLIFRSGAAVAFGLLGMAEAIRERYSGIEWVPKVASVNAVMSYVMTELAVQGVLDVARTDIGAVRREVATALGLLPDIHGY